MASAHSHKQPARLSDSQQDLEGLVLEAVVLALPLEDSEQLQQALEHLEQHYLVNQHRVKDLEDLEQQAQVLAEQVLLDSNNKTLHSLVRICNNNSNRIRTQ